MNVHASSFSRASKELDNHPLPLRIGVVGLGHVGIVTAAALLKDGHTVAGVESDNRILQYTGRGQSPFLEPEVGDLIAEGCAAAKFSVSSDLADVVDLDLVFVCVGTRGLPNGELDLSDVTTVARELGIAVRQRANDLSPLLIVFRSTMLPGSMNKFVLPAIADTAGQSAGTLYEIAYVPEFSREGSAVADHFDASRIVIGERQPGSAHLAKQLFSGFEAPIFATSFETAELAKFADNSFHALKVAFANEIGRFALQTGASPAHVFEIFRADTKLNISTSYLRPGGAFGGPCLGKDVRALASRMKATGICAPVMEHLFESNQRHTDFLIAEIVSRARPNSRLLLVGLSFKEGTDDVRDSPLVTLAETLLDLGYTLGIYDTDLPYDRGTGTLSKIGLPSRIAQRILPEKPNSAEWDLMIIAKHAAHVAAWGDSIHSAFRIDQL